MTPLQTWQRALKTGSKRRKMFILFIVMFCISSIAVLANLVAISNPSPSSPRCNDRLSRDSSYPIPVNDTSLTVPSIPSLMIIGPSKTGTTSLIIELNQRYPDFIYGRRSDQDPAELTILLGAVTEQLAVPKSKLDVFLQWLQSEMVNVAQSSTHSNPYTLSMIRILGNAMDCAQSDGIRLRALYRDRFEPKITNLLSSTNTSWNEPPLIYVVDKCPRNFDNPHVALLMAIHFASPHAVSLGEGLYQSTGTRTLCILRDPMQRLNSWYNMHHEPSDIVHELMNALKEESVRRIHKLIVTNKYDDDGDGMGSNDAMMILEYLQWLYPTIYRSKFDISVFGKYIRVSHVLMSCLYYPQLLIWLQMYSELHLLGTHFKVMSFPYLTSPSTRKEALHHIYLWTKHGIADNADLNALVKEELGEKEGNGSFVKVYSFSKQYPEELVEPLTAFFDPIAPHNKALLSRYDETLIFMGPVHEW